MQYQYQIAGISVLCEIPFPVHIRGESAEFIREKQENFNPDLVVRFLPVQELPPMPEGGFWDLDRYHTGDAVYYCDCPRGTPYARIEADPSNGRDMVCKYVEGRESYLNYSRNLCDIIAVDTLLLNHNGLFLHSSFVRWNGRGILFSAPSGTGKSTQADLWVKHEGAEVLNGDRAGLRLVDGQWTAYGLPYAGTSGIYRNESAPVQGIIVLRQAKENRIRPLGPVEAMGYLYPELTIHHWDRGFTGRAMDLLTALVTGLPIYLLECLPDQGAVNLVRDTLFNYE